VKSLTKDLLSFLLVLIMAYLLLVHYTGFSRDVGAIGSSLTGVTKTLQGR
jgi:hypothetical protein